MGHERHPELPTAAHFGDLVQNAVDFLDRSVVEFQMGDLKYSSIHFCQAIELFVKARLLREHWSLVVRRPEKAKRSLFERGDFQSVSLPEAVERLSAIAGEKLASATTAFESVRQRRNRAIHFHAPEVPAEPDAANVPRADVPPLQDKRPDEVAQIVAEQCAAWCQLHQLLTTKWAAHFADYQKRIEKLHGAMMRLRPYLEARFASLQTEIEALGSNVASCGACGFRSSAAADLFEGMTECRCLVCRHIGRTFHFACPEADCDGTIIVSPDDGGACSKCERFLSVEEVVEQVEPYTDPRDGSEVVRAHCCSCDSYEAGGTVVWVKGAATFVCMNCLDNFESITYCEWCNEPFTGDADATFVFGCPRCDGRLGHKDD